MNKKSIIDFYRKDAKNKLKKNKNLDINNIDSIEGLVRKYTFDRNENLKRDGDNTKEIEELSMLQREYTEKREVSTWTTEKEIQRCNLKNKIKMFLLEKTPEEVEKYWIEKELICKNRFGKDRSVSEREDFFEALKHGILNEMIAWKILEKVPNFRFRAASPSVDIHYKIDFLGHSRDAKTILAVQVKHGSRKRDKIVQELNNLEKETLDKKRFVRGCMRFRKELGLEKRGIDLKSIWIVIPSEDKIGEGGNYEKRLENVIVSEIERILKKG